MQNPLLFRGAEYYDMHNPESSCYLDNPCEALFFSSQITIVDICPTREPRQSYETYLMTSRTVTSYLSK